VIRQPIYRQQRIVRRFAWPWSPIALDGKTRRFGFVRVQQIIALQFKDGKNTGAMVWKDYRIL
jgi:hypothetical protein